MSDRSLSDDELDLVATLQIAPRAPLNLLAEVLGVSVNTVRRRLSRLHDERLIRVIGQLDWSLSGEGNPWHVWVRTERGCAKQVAEHLAGMPDVQMAATAAGRADVYCAVQPARRVHVENLLTEQLQDLDGIRSVHSELVLRAFTKSSSWRLRRLSAEQSAALHTATLPDEVDDELGDELGRDELAAVRLLHEDGRISAAQIARRLGIAPSTAYRLTQSLLHRGVIRPSVEVEPRLLGYRYEAMIALQVRPGQTNTVAEELAQHPSARYVSVTAGTSSVIHGGVFADEEALGEFLTGDLAALGGITSFEVSVLLNIYKRHWLPRAHGEIGATVSRYSRPE
ncbi:Lrp/AsnC family transcriptional regulator [Saccharopolyspora sp. K220]|uniref:Lrp/AsnC family transcriptional regulator n=1 Tax=Saccharopolyspora soli TaxID=2926618 RepID=UPI001F5A8E63|nr:Lrp/AsnC family transcriptional regulator [Saccharopolyspora soli]MCI2421939.1 Lrp/AsnC family transcriptional regulator [Saccharopolyspora soli]